MFSMAENPNPQDVIISKLLPFPNKTKILKAIVESSALVARVVQVNESHVPENRRILIELTGHLPDGVIPMSGLDFQIVGPA